MMSRSEQMWAAFDPSGRMLLWLGSRRTRKEVIAEEAYGCLGADEYADLGSDSARWALARRRGYRIRRVTVAALAEQTGGQQG